MPTPNYFRLFVRSWRLILLVTFLGALLAVAFSFAQPLRYSSTERVLITQTNIGDLDPYTAIKSTERIADNLSEIIYTSSFFNAVMSNNPAINQSYFPQDEISKRNEWQKTIETSVISGTGVMTITAYNTNRDQATDLAVAVANELVSLTPTYFGYSTRVQIIDDPLPSRYFAKPDFLRNALFGLLVGFLLGSAWVLAKARNIG